MEDTNLNTPATPQSGSASDGTYSPSTDEIIHLKLAEILAISVRDSFALAEARFLDYLEELDPREVMHWFLTGALHTETRAGAIAEVITTAVDTAAAAAESGEGGSVAA